MLYSLSKTLPLFLMPVTVGLGLVLLALVFVIRSRRRPAISCLVSAVLILWIAGLPSFAAWILWSLERQYPPVEMGAIPAGDCIVILGGALGADVYPRVEVELTDAIDRVYQGAKLYRHQKGRTIVVAAGNQPWMEGQTPEAVRIRDLLVEWGVPATSIALDTTSRNTRENALNAATLIQANQCQSSLLVTSAWHMPRSVAAFRKADIAVFPVSVDVKLVQSLDGPFTQYVPRVDALVVSSDAFREWIGIWFYRWQGWN